MSREKLDQAIEKNINDVMSGDSGMIEPPNELMERAKLRAKAKGLKPGFPVHSSREACEAVGCIEYPNYGNKETCPPYYARWKIEPNTFNLINGVDTAVGNIIKYIMRHDGKDGLKDLYKARDYLNMMIEHHYGKDKV